MAERVETEVAMCREERSARAAETRDLERALENERTARIGVAAIKVCASQMRLVTLLAATLHGNRCAQNANLERQASAQALKNVVKIVWRSIQAQGPMELLRRYPWVRNAATCVMVNCRAMRCSPTRHLGHSARGEDATLCRCREQERSAHSARRPTPLVHVCNRGDAGQGAPRGDHTDRYRY